MGLLSRLFGGKLKQQKIRFDFIIISDYEEVPMEKWYQKVSWKNKNFVNYQFDMGKDWKWSDEGKIKVAGFSKGNRFSDFIKVAQADGFEMFVREDKENPVDKNARMVMARGIIDDAESVVQVGYLPADIAKKYKGIELGIYPTKLFIPPDASMNPGLEIALMVRSARYLKRKKSR